ncbi:MAG: hypothetical protein HZA82_00035 [Thaumarchaeota archaeon]|nr:hypothetical protein [Nitrososphaerota archaeon]
MNRKFLIAIPVAIGIIATITIFSLNFQNVIGNGKNTENMDPRIVFWRHIHGLGIDPSDHVSCT